MNFESTPEFEKDVKRLKKKWRSLDDDIIDAKLVISSVYELDEPFAQRFFNGKRATKLIVTDEYEVVKMRLDCKSLGNHRKTRLVFIVIRTKSTVKLIELYAKNSNEREDSRRIKKYLT